MIHVVWTETWTDDGVVRRTTRTLTGTTMQAAQAARQLLDESSAAYGADRCRAGSAESTTWCPIRSSGWPCSVKPAPAASSAASAPNTRMRSYWTLMRLQSDHSVVWAAKPRDERKTCVNHDHD